MTALKAPKVTEQQKSRLDEVSNYDRDSAEKRLKGGRKVSLEVFWHTGHKQDVLV